MPLILFGDGGNLTGNFGPYTLYTTPASGCTSTGSFRVSGYVVEPLSRRRYHTARAVQTLRTPGATLLQHYGREVAFQLRSSSCPWHSHEPPRKHNQRPGVYH